MRKEFLFKRIDGTKHQISVEFLLNHRGPHYRIFVYVCQPKKRTFTKVDVSDNYIYRALPFGGNERIEFEMNEFLKHVSKQEIEQSKLAVWELLKP